MEDITDVKAAETTSSRCEMRVQAMGTYLEVYIYLNSRIVATGVGRTLGEALMVTGALMTQTPIVPMHTRILGGSESARD